MERRAIIKIDAEELAVTEFVYPPGAEGPPRHVHHRHSDSFWVLEGEMTFELGEETMTLGAGGFASVPPGVVHTMRNDSPQTARFVNLHTPGANFGDFLRSLRTGEPDPTFDTDDPPEDGGRPASDAVILRAGEGEDVSRG